MPTKLDKLKTTLSIEFLPQRQEPELYAETVASLYNGAGSLFFGAIFGSAVVSVAAYEIGDPRLTAFALATDVAATARILLYLVYHWTRGPGRAGYGYRPWEYAYALGAALFSIPLGLSGMMILLLDPPKWTIVLTIAFTVGYSCGIAARNSLRPWVSSVQMWTSILPLLWVAVGENLSALIFVVGVLALFVSLRKDVARPSYEHFLSNYMVRQAKRTLDHQFDLALCNMSHGLALFDREGRLVFSNSRMANILGLAVGTIQPGTTPADAIAACVRAGVLGADSGAAIAERVELNLAGSSEQEFEIPLSDGRVVEFTFSPISGTGAGTVVVLEDITERKQAAARIERLAHYDTLTGLPNRFTFADRLRESLARSDRFAVLAIDLDKFKAVNDTLGHSVGDRLLCRVAERLQGMAGPLATVSRFGGDEFMVILDMVATNDDAALFARKVVQNLSRPYQIEQHSLIIGASVGIAIGTEHSDDAEALLQYADMALYRVKQEGRGNYMFFDPSMDAAAQEKRRIEVDLREAMAAGQLEVHFQPQFNLAKGSYTTCEALIRWTHPTRGPQKPDVFVPVAEETGMIVEIGEWVLRQSCMAAKAWPDGMRVAVNLSVVQFHAGNLVQTVRRALDDTGLPAHRLELEITESLLMKDAARYGAIMRELKEMGVRISLDDFGKGYSSLGYLQEYPFNKVKVDRDFVKDIGQNRNAKAIVKAVASLSRDMGMSITVEGVEHADQVAILSELGCTDIQGWYYSKALPQAELLGFLRKHPRPQDGEGRPIAA